MDKYVDIMEKYADSGQHISHEINIKIISWITSTFSSFLSCLALVTASLVPASLASAPVAPCLSSLPVLPNLSSGPYLPRLSVLPIVHNKIPGLWDF
jgi:hypothetical protein